MIFNEQADQSDILKDISKEREKILRVNQSFYD